MTVGYHAPPSGSNTGVADYADALLEALRRHGSIAPGADKADVHLYHLGNNRLHQGIYRRALEIPGVIVLHDAVMHHLMLGMFSAEQYLDEWVFNYGEWRREIGMELWRRRAASAIDPDYFRFPMIRRVVERSRLVIVHNPGAAAIAREHGARNVVIIPHFSSPVHVPDAWSVARFRERLRIRSGDTVFGIFGFLRETKRVFTCIEAFKRIHQVRPQTVLLIAGNPGSSDLARALALAANHPGIRTTGHLSRADLLVAAASIDCCLNLRNPSAGETSGIAVLLMGIAKPVILSDISENADFPTASCLRVSTDVAESAELLHYMILVAEFPRIAREIGSEAQLHILRKHALELVAGKYWEALCAAV